MSSILYCASCRRTNNGGLNGVTTVVYQGVEWCSSCAAIKKTPEGLTYVSLPSPGRMYEGAEDDPINAWEDCYHKEPKKRISVKKAKTEIQRAWANWDGNKSSNMAMFEFYGWLTRFRPYFLTFRGHGDPWQTVHCWLEDYERKQR
jgi:hypothetical protein